MNAIEVANVTKIYRRYGRRRHFGTLKSALLTGRFLRDLRPDEVLEALKGVSFNVEAGFGEARSPRRERGGMPASG